MEESLLSKIAAKIGIAIFVIAIVDIIYINWWIFKSDKTSSQSVQNTSQAKIIKVESPEPAAVSSPATPSQNQTAPTPDARLQPQTIIEKETKTVIQNANKEIFIPLGSGSTFSYSFSDLSGTDITVDTSKYPGIDSVVFEASVWVNGGNGRAYAQLYNVNDKNPFFESQISNNTGSGVVKTSTKIPIPSGQKTYRIQAKTDITQYAAHVDNARLKITLR